MPKRDKILFICLVGTIMITIALCCHIVEHESMCGNIRLDEQYKAANLVPDEETAEKIAHTIIEANGGFEEGWFFKPRVEFNERTNRWEVGYIKMTPDQSGIDIDGGGWVHIDRDSGMITELYCKWWNPHYKIYIP